MNKYQRNVSKWSQNPLKINPGPQQRTALKNRAQQIEKISKNDSQMDPQKWLYFGGFASCGAFGDSNRFCDQKWFLSAPKMRWRLEKINKKWHQRSLRVRKWAPKADHFRSQAKMSSKSGPFSDLGPADCAKRLQSSTYFDDKHGVYGSRFNENFRSSKIVPKSIAICPGVKIRHFNFWE